MSRKAHIKWWNRLVKWIFYTNIIFENTLWSLWLPNSIDLLLPIRNYRLPEQPFPRNIEICEIWKYWGRLKIITKFCKNCEKYYSLIAEPLKPMFYARRIVHVKDRTEKMHWSNLYLRFICDCEDFLLTWTLNK